MTNAFTQKPGTSWLKKQERDRKTSEAAGLDPEGTTVEFSNRENNMPPITVSVAETIAALRQRLELSPPR